MAPTDYPKQPHFNLSFPSPYIAHVEIDRPEKLNAFTEPMVHSLGAIFNQLSVDPDVRAIVLSGAGAKAFTAGLDVQSATESGPLSQKEADGPKLDTARKAVALRRHILQFQASVSAVEECEKPVIAVLHGISYGIALDITTCCDVRYCSRDVRFSVKEVDIGLAADVGTLTRLPKANLPMSWIKEVSLTAREFGADEALRVGLVSGVFETREVALEKALGLARVMAEKSPVAVQATKEVLNFSRDHSVRDGEFFGFLFSWSLDFRVDHFMLTLDCESRSELRCGLQHEHGAVGRCQGLYAEWSEQEQEQADFCEAMSCFRW
jgi:delta(3,5)-delta(2,4)-dienoyl-CoA isomerase